MQSSQAERDAFLEERLARIDGWRKEGRLTHSSRVIPIGESLRAEQWVLPSAQIVEILRGARRVAITDCLCRTRYRRCDNPMRVCLLLDEFAESRMAEGSARPATLAEAEEALRVADAAGLVHLAIYDPEQPIRAVCSCCTCCCHELQALRRYGRGDLIARSDYVAVTDADACKHCGDCIERCAFGARTWDGATLRYDAAACYGCGLCAVACPSGATTIVRRG
ncbi:MAG: 4Fe-4S binding protein [Anaerolineae bacterium]|nr:4Fe-4S binding protein [Anaerolineae bacterium]